MAYSTIGNQSLPAIIMDRAQPDSGEGAFPLLESELYLEKNGELSRISTDADLMKAHRPHNE